MEDKGKKKKDNADDLTSQQPIRSSCTSVPATRRVPLKGRRESARETLESRRTKRAARSSISTSCSLSAGPANDADEDVSMIDPALLQLTAESQASASPPQSVHLPPIRRTSQPQSPLVKLPGFSELAHTSMRLIDDDFGHDMNISYAAASHLPSLSSNPFAPIAFSVNTTEASPADNYSSYYSDPFDEPNDGIYPFTQEMNASYATAPRLPSLSSNHFAPSASPANSFEAIPTDNYSPYCTIPFDEQYDEIYPVLGERSNTHNSIAPSMFTQPHHAGNRYFEPSPFPANALHISRSNPRLASYTDHYSGRDDERSLFHGLSATANVPSRGILRRPRQVGSPSSSESEMDPLLSHADATQAPPRSSSASRRVRFSEELQIQSFDASSAIYPSAHKVFTVEWVHAMDSPEVAAYVRRDAYLSGAPRHTKASPDPRDFPGAAQYRDCLRQMHSLANVAAPNFPRLQFNSLVMIHRSEFGQRITVDVLTGDWSMAAREGLYGGVIGEIVFEFGARLLAAGEMRTERRGV